MASAHKVSAAMGVFISFLVALPLSWVIAAGAGSAVPAVLILLITVALGLRSAFWHIMECRRLELQAWMQDRFPFYDERGNA